MIHDDDHSVFSMRRDRQASPRRARVDRTPGARTRRSLPCRHAGRRGAGRPARPARLALLAHRQDDRRRRAGTPRSSPRLVDHRSSCTSWRAGLWTTDRKHRMVSGNDLRYRLRIGGLLRRIRILSGAAIALAACLIAAPAHAATQVLDGSHDATDPRAAQAKPPSPTDIPETGAYAVAPSGAVFSFDEEIVDTEPPADSSTDIEPYLLDPLAWPACYVAMDDTYTIRTYTYWRQSGGTWTIKLNPVRV